MSSLLHSFKASPIAPDRTVDDLALLFDTAVPDAKPDEHFEAWYRETYEREGDQVEAALFKHLPGGLYDQILRAMLARKASLLKVSHKD